MNEILPSSFVKKKKNSLDKFGQSIKLGSFQYLQSNTSTPKRSELVHKMFFGFYTLLHTEKSVANFTIL